MANVDTPMRGVALLLLILLMASSSAAWTGGQVESVAVRDATLAGAGLVLKVNQAQEDTTPSLSIQAERLNATIYRSYQDFNPPRAGFTLNQNNSHERREWSDAAVELIKSRPGIVIFLNTTDATVVQDTRMTVGGHAKQAVQDVSTTQGEPPLASIPVGSWHQLGTTAAAVTVTGDFRISVWDVDLRIQNETDTAEHWSGARNTTGPLSPAIHAEENQRIYLDVTNGRLHLTLDGLRVLDLFVAGTTLQATSAVVDLAGQDAPLSLAGPLTFGLGPVSNGAFQGDVNSASAELPPILAPSPQGDAPAPSTVAASDEGLWTTSLLLVVGAVAAVLFVAWRAARLLRLRRARDDGDYRSVAAGAGLENSRRFGPEVVVARVVCMVKTGEFDAASSLLEKRGDRLSPAVCAYLWACIHAGAGAVDEARDAVVRSVMADPGMAVEVAANGSLRRFLADVGEGGYS